MPPEPDPDLRWTALLYVLGDLDPASLSSFEDRLADDPSAREAVIEAVDLAEGLAAVGAVALARRRSIGRRAIAGAAFLAAACLTLAAIPHLRPERPDRPDASEVALAWSSLRKAGEADALASTAASRATEASEASRLASTLVEAEVDAEPSADRALPSWLLSAASTRPAEAPRQED